MPVSRRAAPPRCMLCQGSTLERRPRHALAQSAAPSPLAARPRPTGCSASTRPNRSIPPAASSRSTDAGAPLAERDRAAAAPDDAAWRIAPPSACCSAAPAPSICSTTPCARCGRGTATPRTAAISGRSTPTARASATSSPTATPSCCSPRRAPNAPAIPTPTGCSPTSPKFSNSEFWEARYGASAEEFREDWTPFSDYRGQNANMHLTEALMAAFEATGERGYLAKAESIADLILRRRAARGGLARARAFSRRLERRSRTIAAPTCSARSATRRATRWNGRGSRCNSGRSAGGGWNGCRRRRGGCSRRRSRRAGTPSAAGSITRWNTTARPRVRDRLWWPICEGIGAAHFLGALDGDACEAWYRRLLGFRRAAADRRAPRRLALPTRRRADARYPAISSASPTSTTRCRPA